ncbi:MAG: hypothetical protein Roseis2KO_08540 [Roseivirga sp.]
MFSELSNINQDFFDNYLLIILWLVLIGEWSITILKRKRKARSRDYLPINGESVIHLPLKPNINWPLSIITLLLCGTMLPILVYELIATSWSNDDMITLIWALLLGVLWVVNSLRRLSLKFTKNEIVFDDDHYEASEIEQMEIWDDLIFIRFKNGKEKKIWLRFRAKRYQEALALVSAVEDFCNEKGVSLENNFSSDIEFNEVFNPSQ